MKINPLLTIDFYKVDHRRQYPANTTEIYSNFTARGLHGSTYMLPDYDNKVVMFGLQHFINNFLVNGWNKGFFNRDKHAVINEYKEIVMDALNLSEFDTSHLEALHDLGFLPIKIKSIEEGKRVPLGVPLLTIVNTHPDFAWLTNYLETALSSYLWKPITNATIAFEFRRLMEQFSAKTCEDNNHIQFQCHDFSFRGMSGVLDAAISGAAHLLSFKGTDSVPAISFLQQYYGANSRSELIGVSVPATEHSVICMGGEDNECLVINRLITETYPSGIVSIVCDTYNFWRVLRKYLPYLYKEIINRDGKVVIRPDSGDPLKIICGDKSKDAGSDEFKGALELLWNLFGGTNNSKGYKVLDAHIGLIYGDSITLERANLILTEMERQGFASSNIVFGIGSYTYQHVTRDTFGMAMKATSAVVNGERIELYKDPITSNGTKKSAKGLLKVINENNTYVLIDRVSEEEEKEGLLREVHNNYYQFRPTTLSKIRDNIDVALLTS